MLNKLKNNAGLLIIIVVIILIYVYYLSKNKEEGGSSESSFAPGPGAPARGGFAPIPGAMSGGGGAGLAPPPPPSPSPAPPSGGAPIPPPPPPGPTPHPHPPQPWPYPWPYFWGGPNYVYGLDIVDNIAPPCYKRVTVGDGAAERTVCMSRREYVIYVQGRREYWIEKLKVAKSNGAGRSKLNDIQAKIDKTNRILSYETNV